MTTKRHHRRPAVTTIAAVIAILFGLLTITSGGVVIFGDPAVRSAAGDVVLFVLWFNFLAGFAYVIAGLGLFLRREWAAPLALLIATANVVAFAALGAHIAMGGAYEIQTIAAMALRTGVWIAIAFISGAAMKRAAVS